MFKRLLINPAARSLAFTFLEQVMRSSTTDKMSSTRTQEQHSRRFSPGNGHDDEMAIVTLMKRLRDETIQLLHQEVQLVKTEMQEKANRFVRNGIYIAIGGVVALLGGVFLLLAVSQGIVAALVLSGMSMGVAMWLGPLIVGMIVAIAGYALLQKGINTLQKESMTPKRTARSLQENKEWITEKAT